MPADYQFIALDPAPFAALFDASDAELAALGARREVVNAVPGFPCRVSLTDAPMGETVLLLHHTHHDVTTPYRASGPIYVRRDQPQAQFAPGEVPALLRHRLLSLRAYDADGWMLEATVSEGRTVESAIDLLLSDPRVGYVDVHNAKPGCFNCRVIRR